MQHYDLISCLSNESRTSILFSLVSKNIRPVDLAKKLGLTISAVSKHISKLEATLLIKKTSKGCLVLSPLGKAVLNKVEFFNFLANYQEYLINYSIKDIPKNLLQRLHELSDANFIHGKIATLEKSREVFNSSKKYIKLAATRTFTEAYKDAINLIDQNGIRIFAVYGKNTKFPMHFSSLRKDEGINEYVNKGYIVERIVDHVGVSFILTEKEACILFSDKNPSDQDSTSIFYSSDSRFMEWCTDIFDYYWKKSKPMFLEQVTLGEVSSTK